jgi:hypothetical protein
MNPIASHYQAQVHLEELHRLAARARRHAHAGAVAGPTWHHRLRGTLGGWLIATGQRMVPGAVPGTVGTQR